MLRRVSRWGVTALGVVLAICGVVAMAGRLGHHPGRTGVEPVYRRRDDLGRRRRRDRVGSGRLPARRNTRGDAVASDRGKIARAFRPRRQAATKRAGAAFETAVAASAPGPNASANARPNAARSTGAAPLPARPRRSAAPSATEPEREAEAPAADEPSGAEPREVDRYQSGDITYVMFSDGAVEVRTSNGSQRFASLAELRAQAAQQY